MDSNRMFNIISAGGPKKLGLAHTHTQNTCARMATQPQCHTDMHFHSNVKQ